MSEAEGLYPLISISRLRMATDGSGITTLVAGAGCPLKCRWCINKRLLAEAPVEMVSVEELLNRVKVDDIYFQATRGGITFGGGEPLLHASFIRCFCEICPKEWSIRVETSLAVRTEQLDTVLDAVNEFIVDCKSMDPAIYQQYTGKSSDLMTENLRHLLQSAGPERVRVRVPLIPEYNNEADQAQSANLLRKMGVCDPELFEYVIR